MGAIVDNPADFYHSQIPKKQRKKIIVEELLADSEFRRYNQRKYSEIMAEKLASAAGKNFKRRNFAIKIHQGNHSILYFPFIYLLKMFLETNTITKNSQLVLFIYRDFCLENVDLRENRSCSPWTKSRCVYKRPSHA